MKLELRKLLQMLGVLQPDPVFYIGGSDVLPQPLAPAQEQALLRELAAGSESAKQTLIERNLRLVVYLARRFENTGIGMEDLISIGTIGLIKAVSTFRVDRNIKLATYASRCIENEILMYIRKISGQKAEVSLDEPINTDWTGTSCCCLMFWVPNQIRSCARWRTTWTMSCCARRCPGSPSGRCRLCRCASDSVEDRRKRRRRSPS